MIKVSDEYACDADGRDVECRKVFGRVCGTRDGTARKATEDEQTAVAMNLYFYFCNVYEKAEKDGHWKIWDEESAFPHEEYAFESFESHTTRDVDGVFDGFDFNGWAADNLLNGLVGVTAIGVDEDDGSYSTKWDHARCGDGLKKKIDLGIRVYIDSDESAHSGLSISAKKKKKDSIMDNILIFLTNKGMPWGHQQYLYTTDGNKSINMKGHFGKKIAGVWYILKLKCA